MTKSASGFGAQGPALRAAALAAAALILAACGGGGSPVTGGPKPPPVTKPPPGQLDPEEAPLVRLRVLRERADALRMTGLHGRWSLAAEGEEDLEDTFVESVTCAGARCVAADGPATAAGELLGPAIAPGADPAQTGERGGFDTVKIVGGFAVTETLPDLAVTGSPQATTWGFWGAHGFAGLTLGAGSLSAETDGTTRSGTFSLAQAWAAGTVSGGHPAGSGRATWTGLAEASPKGTFGRIAGTATVTIEDLSRPRVDVGIALDGVEAPLRWTDLPLAGGRFSAGTAGTDRLDGHFHGPVQEEAYGVFDTDRWLGAFGAKRRP